MIITNQENRNAGKEEAHGTVAPLPRHAAESHSCFPPFLIDNPSPPLTLGDTLQALIGAWFAEAATNKRDGAVYLICAEELAERLSDFSHEALAARPFRPSSAR
jgi:hypothetical protein